MRIRAGVRRCLLVAVVCVAAVAATGVAADAAQPGYHRYVALGDSYTAGPLIPFQRLDPLGCFRSTDNYPSLLARQLAVDRFVDVSCSGADTGDMTTAQPVPLGSNAPQFDALTAETDLVTLGIGGNDNAVFGTLIGTCPGLRASDPTGAPCRDKFTVNGVDTIKVAIKQTQANVTAVLAGIHQRSPAAAVLVVGYPRIAPPTGYCPSRLPLADGDYAWANSVEVALNSALRDAVATDGASSYVDTFTPSLGHDICATNGAAWINGQGLKLLRAAPYHPFESAMIAEASLLYKALGGANMRGSYAAATTAHRSSPHAGVAALRTAVTAARW
ncbi:MAG: SGNH/GDSL hydrolase family protein [Sciscionella sp.]